MLVNAMNAMNAMNANPEASVISGKTVYARRGLGERMLSLLSRSYVDAGQAGVTRFISNNNAAWRREVFLAHPFPAGLGPFCGKNAVGIYPSCRRPTAL